MATIPVHQSGDGMEGAGAGLQSLLRMLQVLFFLLRILIIAIFVWLVFSGVFKVDDGKEALLFRFGRLQHKVIDPNEGPTAVLTSGRWYWAWPYPVDRRRIIPAQQAVSVSTEEVFWPRVNPNLIDQTQAGHLSMAPLAPGQDGYLLTGDTNIMHTVWRLTYRVTDAVKYYLNVVDDEQPASAQARGSRRSAGHEAVIRNVLANCALAEVANWNIEDVLRSARGSTADPEVKELLTDNVRQRVEQRLAALDIGIEVQLLNLVEIQPPTATLDAFRKVVAAAQDQRTLIDEAERYAATVVPAAQGDAYRILDEARAYRTRIVESVQAESAYFQTVLAEYRRNPRTMLMALHSDTVRDVLEKVQNKYVIAADKDGRQEIRIQLGPEPPKIGGARQSEPAN